MNTKLIFKKIVAGGLFYTGMFKTLHKVKKNLVILMYHRVIQDNSLINTVQPGMYVTVETFNKQMKYLRNNYKVISFGELIDLISKNESITNCLFITFDDGWVDNYTQAFKILKELEIPATIFLTTYYIGTNRSFWPEELIFFLSQIDHIHLNESEIVYELCSQITTKPGTELYYDEAVDLLKKWTPEKRESLLSNLRERCPSPPPQRQMMNWDEVKEMYDSGLITFGAHTANHVILDQVPLEEAEREIAQSKNDIIEHLGVAPEYFAYPNGNFTPKIKELLKKQGFKAAVTTKKGIFASDVDLLESPRIGMHEDVSNTVPMFLVRMYLKWF